MAVRQAKARKRLAVMAQQGQPDCDRLRYAAEVFGWPVHSDPLTVEVPFGPSEPFRTLIEFADFLSGLVPRLFSSLRAHWITAELNLPGDLQRANDWPPVLDLLPVDAPDAQRLIDNLKLQTLAHPIMDVERQSIWGYWLTVRGELDGRGVNGEELFRWAAQNNLLYALDQRCLRHHLARIRQSAIVSSRDRFVINVQFETLRNMDVGMADLRDELLQSSSLPGLYMHVPDSARVVPVEELARRCNELRKLGVGIAATDAAQGFADVDWLRTLRPDLLRISSALLNKLNGSPLHTATAESIVDLGSTLNAPVVAQGVDTPEAQRRVLGLNVSLRQGSGLRQLQSFVL